MQCHAVRGVAAEGTRCRQGRDLGCGMGGMTEDTFQREWGGVLSYKATRETVTALLTVARTLVPCCVCTAVWEKSSHPKPSRQGVQAPGLWLTALPSSYPPCCICLVFLKC